MENTTQDIRGQIAEEAYIVTVDGEKVLVDPEDLELLRRIPWKIGPEGYPEAKLYMHRFVMGNPEGRVVDHRHRNKLDCRKKNLRICSHADNSRNRVGHQMKQTSSRFKGVAFSPDRRRGRWRAYITINYKRHGLGGYETEEDAARSYDAAARYYHGEFALLNFPGDDSPALSCRQISERNRKARRAAGGSEYRGVYRNTRGGKPWRAQISVANKSIPLGYFDTEEDAALAFDRAAIQ